MNILAQETEHLTARLDTIIRAQAGERVFHHLDQIRRLAATTRHHDDRLSLKAKRRSVLGQLWRLAQHWDAPEEPLEALWQTEEVRERRVGPLQEVENAVFYFKRTIFETAADSYATFDAELAAHYPTVKRPRPFLTFARWVGGDRDGNPFVTPDVSRTTAQWHTCVAMDFYERECAKLVEELAHASPPCPRSRGEETGDAFLPFRPYEVFRARLASLRRKLRAGKGEGRELIAVLEEVRLGLLRQRAHRAAHGRIQRLLTQARTFGPHLAEFDFRDRSGKLDSAEAELLEEFRAMCAMQKKHGPQAANRFILSMSRSADDVLRLLTWMDKAGVWDIDLVPLFERIHDLENASRILTELWADPHYRAHLKHRGRVPEVMGGYSDSKKDGGCLAANGFLYRAQKEMSPDILQLLEPARIPAAIHPRLGRVGGGQLAKMTALAGLQLGCAVVVLERNNYSPAANLASPSVVGDWDNPEALLKLASQVDVVTLENEFADAASLRTLEPGGYRRFPMARSIALVQDKLVQKQTLAAAGLPVPPFCAVGAVGSFGVELFLTASGEIFINESAGFAASRGWRTWQRSS